MAQKRMGVNEPEQRCVKCQQSLTFDEFYKSANPNHTRGILPYCKECCKKIFKNYLEELGSLQGAYWATCAEVGVPYIQSVGDSAQEMALEKIEKKGGNITTTSFNYFGTYISRLALMKVNNKWDRFIDSDVDMGSMVSLEERKAKIEAEIAKFRLAWGDFDSEDDYAFLEFRYDIYTEGISLKPAQETLYRKLCIAESQARKIEAKGGDTKNIQKQILDLMSKLKIDNFAEQKDKDLTEQMLEAQIAMHEKQMPMEYYDQKELYEDACGLNNGWNRIKRVMLNFAFGHKDYPKVHNGGVDG